MMFLEIFIVLLFALMIFAIFIYGIYTMQLSGKAIIVGLIFGVIGVILVFKILLPIIGDTGSIFPSKM